LRRTIIAAAACCAILTLLVPSAPSGAQDDTEKAIEKYRQMLSEDPWSNPGLLDADRGEALWKTAAGPNKATLEQCDLGKGPGVVDGAFAELPRYFADAGKVMDLEQRLLWCMETVQKLDTKDVVARRFSAPGRDSDMEDLVAFVANKSSWRPIELALAHPKEQEAYAVGEAMFFRRSAIMDFSCATCHAEDGKRIRLQALPDLSRPTKAAKETMGSLPTYRVSQAALRTMQHRLWDCYRQMRMPAPDYASDGLTALTVFLAKQAEGATLDVPSIKR